MAATINTNIMALNTARTLDSHYSRLSTSVRRLSSGLRIGTAADDAAGLAIRELMRADIASFNQGVRNANDAISLLQLADGALAIIDEKLIRMKELAEQAATGTYDSTQRLMIDSEFQAMADEIDRIARATDFNGLKLLDGSLSGAHDGSGFSAMGRMKIHFGTGNDSAEDYYYVEIGDCSTRGLGLRSDRPATTPPPAPAVPSTPPAPPVTPGAPLTLNDCGTSRISVRMPATGLANLQDLFQNGAWSQGMSPSGGAYSNFMFRIPAGTRKIVVNTNGADLMGAGGGGHNDAQLFTATGKHLAGTPLDDFSWKQTGGGGDDVGSSLAESSNRLPFNPAAYDDSALNSGPADYSGDQTVLELSSYNGMTIGYSGDGDRHDTVPNDGKAQSWPDYQVLTIDEAKEDLIVMFPGVVSGYIKVYWDVPDDEFTALTGHASPPVAPGPAPGVDPDPGQEAVSVSIETQDKAQKALVAIDAAIVRKDSIRAHIGALQNRFENTVSNLAIQAENMQASESRISDADIALEMMDFVRNQILTQSAAAMLAQANSFPNMLKQLIG